MTVVISSYNHCDLCQKSYHHFIFIIWSLWSLSYNHIIISSLSSYDHYDEGCLGRQWREGCQRKDEAGDGGQISMIMTVDDHYTGDDSWWSSLYRWSRSRWWSWQFQERKNQPVQWDLDKWGNPIWSFLSWNFCVFVHIFIKYIFNMPLRLKICWQ